MKILIIGSKGFIGQHTVNHFRKNESYVVYEADVVVDYNNSNYFIIDSSNSDFNDIFETHQFDYCINCSGAASVPDSIVHTVRDFNLNTYNVLKLLEAIKKHNSSCKFINLSSAAIYGNPKSLPISENHALAPISPYGIHKKMAEDILKEYHQCFNIQTCSLRIFSAYGEGLKKQLLWDIYDKTLKGNSISLFGTGKETRDYIHVLDIVQCIELIMKYGSFNADTYNIANGEEVTTETVASCVCKFADYHGKINFTGDNRKGDPLNWLADIAKIKALGYQQQVSLTDGIKNYVKWRKDEV